MHEPQKTCLILHGGAMKSALAAGFAYGLAERGISRFDVVLGVSSSVGTAAAVASGQFKELRSAWRNDLTSAGFISWKRLLAGEPIFDVDWLIDEVFRKRYKIHVGHLISASTTFATCAYNFKEDRIDFFTSKDTDFREIVWDAMKASMTIHEKHGVWIRGYQYTDAELVPYRMYEQIPFAAGYKTLIVSNHHDQTYNLRSKIGGWLFLHLQGRSFPEEVRAALKNRAAIVQKGLDTLAQYIREYGAVLYKPPKDALVPFWSVVTFDPWLMRYYFDRGVKNAELFVSDPENAHLIATLRERSNYLAQYELHKRRNESAQVL